MSTGNYIKNLRLRKGWSLATLAKKLDEPTSTYRGWEKGTKIPAEGLRKIAQVYGVSTTEILNLTEERTENITRLIYYLEAALELAKESQS